MQLFLEPLGDSQKPLIFLVSPRLPLVVRLDVDVALVVAVHHLNVEAALRPQ